jgi:hypothetical protein
MPNYLWKLFAFFSGDIMRRCTICEKPLSTYNKKDVCFCHYIARGDFGADPKGFEIRMRKATSPTPQPLLQEEIDRESRLL